MTKTEFREWLKYHDACHIGFLTWFNSGDDVMKARMRAWFDALERFDLHSVQSASHALITRSLNKWDHLPWIVSHCKQASVDPFVATSRDPRPVELPPGDFATDLAERVGNRVAALWLRDYDGEQMACVSPFDRQLRATKAGAIFARYGVRLVVVTQIERDQQPAVGAVDPTVQAALKGGF